MAISLKPQHLNRYRQIAWLFMKYGRSDLVKESGLEETLEAEQRATPKEQAKASELADDLEKLGPTFVKLGQLLSTRVEMMPQAYIEALTRLQDKVEPFSYDEVEKIITSELGVRLSKAFSEFESTPMAAASLGQVHKARLRNGRQVAVKVQRPEIRNRMIEDLDALEEIAEFLDGHTEFGKRYEFGEMLDQFRKSLLRELDYRPEAGNLTTLREQLKGFERLIVPEPIADYSTSRVLTMEYVHGRKVTDLSALGRMEFNGDDLAEEVFRAYLELKDLLQRLPTRLNKILDAIANNEMKLSVDAIDEKTLVVGFQKVANRITVGLIIAALIVGAAMMMRVDTTFRIWGYPGLAILLFLAAAGAGVVLLVNILFYDKSEKD